MSPLPPLPPAAAMAPDPSAPQAVVIAPQSGAAPSHEIRLRILRSNAEAMAALPALPPGLSQRAHSLAPRGPAVITALPQREIEGLRAEGERSRWTIEAGQLGNEKPIVITREVWRSPELLLTLQTTDFDPRSGEHIYRLLSLKRGEPDAALMKVPADHERRGAPARPALAPKAKV